jgi:hypothetical protein
VYNTTSVLLTFREGQKYVNSDFASRSKPTLTSDLALRTLLSEACACLCRREHNRQATHSPLHRFSATALHQAHSQPADMDA